MATTVVDKDFIEALATEIACSVDSAVERWIADIDSVLRNPLLTDEDKVKIFNTNAKKVVPALAKF